MKKPSQEDVFTCPVSNREMSYKNCLIKRMLELKTPGLYTQCRDCEKGKEIKEMFFIGNKELDPNKKEEGMAKKSCEVGGCKSGAVKDGLCHRHYKEKHGENPWGNPSKKKGQKARKAKAKKARKSRKAARGGERPPAPPSPPEHLRNSKTRALLGQLLYASECLDKALDSVLETGTYETTDLFSVRQRVGAVLSGDLGGVK